MMWVFLFILLLIVVVVLAYKLYTVYASLNVIRKDLAWILEDDTNRQLRLPYEDKTMRRLTEELNLELRKLRRERIKYERGNVELKNAVSSISHDLRTPLTAIIGYTELLQEKERTPEETRYLDIIRKRCESLRRLTEELFSYAIVSTITVEEEQNEQENQNVDIRSVLELCVAGFYQDLKKRKIEPLITLPDVPVMKVLNEEYLLRVFSNLISNAVKYSDGDLMIDMTTEGKVRFENHASQLDKLQVERLFDRFYTVQASRESTGLGLTVAKLLTEKMGGEIHAEFEDGILRIEVTI